MLNKIDASPGLRAERDSSPPLVEVKDGIWSWLAPVLGGWLVEAGGYPLAFIAAAIFGIAAFVLLTWFVRDPQLAAPGR